MLQHVPHESHGLLLILVQIIIVIFNDHAEHVLRPAVDAVRADVDFDDEAAPGRKRVSLHRNKPQGTDARAEGHTHPGRAHQSIVLVLEAARLQVVVDKVAKLVELKPRARSALTRREL